MPPLSRILLALACCATVAVLSIPADLARADGWGRHGPNKLQIREQLKDLMVCYGTGTDAIGDSTSADPLGDGKEIYGKCFTEDAVFRVWFPGTPFDGDPTIPPVVGPDAWAEFVFGAFDGTYTFTQHMLSNFIYEIKGRRAKLSAYLNASHVIQEENAVTQVDVANGTYTLKIKKIRGRYRIVSLDLTLLNFNPFFAAE